MNGMSSYWDSSALLNAIVSQSVAGRIAPGDVTRSHAFCEIFAVLTGRGLPTKRGRMAMSNSDAARVIEKLGEKLTLRDLTWRETLTALRDASSLGVQGGRVHDLMHARSAVLSKVERVLTRNVADFSGLTGAIPVEMP
jgi:hypothetical protein